MWGRGGGSGRFGVGEGSGRLMGQLERWRLGRRLGLDLGLGLGFERRESEGPLLLLLAL